jgi:hypothetical protein
MEDRSMHRFAFPSAALLALAPLSLAQHGHEQAADAGEMFRSRCHLCHVPPDARFAVDRAWLTQVADTA